MVGLTDANGSFVAQYTYDAWGNILTATGTMAEINPLRYRGYYYDTETGFYYLQSRYYDPVNHRFLNADVYASTDATDAVACNMFAYCGNNPIIFSDCDGEAAAICIACDTSPMSRLWDDALGGGMVVVALTVVSVAVAYNVYLAKKGKAPKGKEKTAEPEPPDVTCPGDDPEKAPEGYTWRGKGSQGSKEGGYANARGGKDSWHPDLKHGGNIEPHWDYNDGYGHKWRVFLDDNIEFVK